MQIHLDTDTSLVFSVKQARLELTLNQEIRLGRRSKTRFLCQLSTLLLNFPF